MRIHPSNTTRILVLAICVLCSSTLLLADVTGSITGVVRDRSQASVAGARVQVTNVETNLTQETASGADGSFRILALPAGKYKLTASSPGFRMYTATEIDLKVNDQLHFDITLQIGSVQENVSVEANAVQVETESTQLGDVVESKKMLSLPLNGRSYLDLLGLQAGVVPVTSGSIQQDRPVSGYIDSPGNLSVNGQRETSNAFLVNGGDVSEGRNMGAGLIPNLDSVEEFRLITNSFDAEYGKFSGSVMNAITKSGTNSIHGDVFEFLRNDKFDATRYFDDSVAELRQNQFGYAIGGPLWKNKIFWFTDYQGTRIVHGASTGNVQVPSAAERGGDFSADTADLTGTVQGGTWADMLTARYGYPVNVGEAYYSPGCTNNTQCVFPNAVIPTPFAAPAVGILPYIPSPNAGVNIFSDNSQRDRVRDDKAAQRIDFMNEKTGNWSFYYHYDDSTVTSAFGHAASVPGFETVTPSRAQEFVISNTKNFGPTAVNQFRVSFFRTATLTDKPTQSFAKLADLGFETGTPIGINPSGPAGFPQTVPPLFFNNFSIGVNTLTTYQPNNTYQISDGFSKAVGSHMLKFGGEFRYLQINERNTCAPNGDFTFNGAETGSDFADFLIGAPNEFNQCSQQLLDSRTRYGGAYVQDTYKVKSNITLNLGLRWEVSMPWYDTQGKIETIVPGLQSTQFPTAPLGWVVPGDPGIPSTLAPTRYNNFAPRVGIAYSPGFSDGLAGKIFGGPGKTSIRAAYGVYYTSIEDLNLFYEVGDAPFGLYWVSPQPTLFDQPYVTRADGSLQTPGGSATKGRFPFTFPKPGSPANATLDYSTYTPLSYSPGYDIHNRLPYAEHYDLSIERQLSKNTVLTLSYVGTQGHRLISQYDANPGDRFLCQQLNTVGAVDTSTGGACEPFGEQDVYALPIGMPAPAKAFTTSCPSGFAGSVCINGTRDFLGPKFSQNNSFTVNIANSNYNSGQVSLEHKAGNMTFLAAYTYSKAIDNSSGFGQWVNWENPRLTRSLSSFDTTHNFVFSYAWLLPFDKAFANAPRRLTQGWNLSGIVRFTGGFPIPISESSDDFSLTGSSNTDEPDLVGKVVTYDPRRQVDADGNHYFFNPSAFAPGPLGAFGNANRQFFHGPGINNFDISLMKRTNITESKAFEIRAEFFNMFNHTQFNNPDGDLNGSMGVVSSARDPRIGQLSAKFIF
ncbi:MAG TPA: carboxypeptidase regulatory-like domain-containing protein [Terriglobales bacterium]